MYHGTNISNMLKHVEISQVFGANSSDHHSNGVHTALRLRSATNPGAAKGVLRGNRTHQSLDLDVTKLSRNSGPIMAYHGQAYQALIILSL